MKQHTHETNFLTAHRLDVYKQTQKVRTALLVALFAIFLLRGKSFYGELLVVWCIGLMSWTIYLLMTKKTLWHLRSQELAVIKKRQSDTLKEMKSGVKK